MIIPPILLSSFGHGSTLFANGKSADADEAAKSGTQFLRAFFCGTPPFGFKPLGGMRQAL
jgi:hypothetical protein